MTIVTVFLKKGSHALRKFFRTCREVLGFGERRARQRHPGNNAGDYQGIAPLDPDYPLPRGRARSRKSANTVHPTIRPGITNFCKPQDRQTRAGLPPSDAAVSTTLRRRSPVIPGFSKGLLPAMPRQAGRPFPRSDLPTEGRGPVCQPRSYRRVGRDESPRPVSPCR